MAVPSIYSVTSIAIKCGVNRMRRTSPVDWLRAQVAPSSLSTACLHPRLRRPAARYFPRWRAVAVGSRRFFLDIGIAPITGGDIFEFLAGFRSLHGFGDAVGDEGLLA
ncbi:hypothetical protein [Tardiphaga sp.]|uniref:hypothetical protein n=1 Tax=Tardiphaga sp. TaxID=1926292 RepID=UPI002603446A|nr:hypothetical protein [Tardiphaga sp.]